MPKKIYDIKPPRMARKKESSVKEPTVEIKKIKHHTRHKEETNSFWRPLSIVILLVVAVAGVYLFFKLPKADIIISPKVDTLSFQQTIIADKGANSVDLVKNVIPAKYFETNKTESQDFLATGNASNQGQASGTITIFNKFDPATPFTFKAGTHFMSDSGKLFVAAQKVVVPAAKKTGSKITPGSVQVTVQAVEGGESYNIAPANFSIPGLKGTSYYYSIYATSAVAMSGGYSGKVKKVTDDDIQGAKDVLSKKTTTDAMADLKSKIPSDYVLLDNAVSSTVTTASTATKSGTVAQNFNYQTAVKASALAFKKSDLDEFAKNYIAGKIDQGKTLLDNSYKINYTAPTVDVSGGKATLSLNFSSGVYKSVDKNSLVLSLMGKNASQINQAVNESLDNQVSDIKIKFWPFWVTSAPNSQKAVNIQLKF